MKKNIVSLKTILGKYDDELNEINNIEDIKNEN